MMIDIIVMIVMVLALYKGLRNGLIMAVFSFLSFVIGLAAALKLSTLVAGYLGDNTSISKRWLPALAFFLVFILVGLWIRMAARLLEGFFKIAMLGWLNRLGGFLFYALLYIFLFSILVFYAEKLNLLNPQTIEASVTYPYIKPVGPFVINSLGIVLPFFRNMFSELESFFGHIAQHAS
jgi:membrane protein required for colicin V production